MATAITYSTDGKRSHLRTVVVEDVKTSVVLLPSGALDVVTAKYLHGTTCAKESFWDEVLGQDNDDNTLVIPTAQIRAQREIKIATIVRRHVK